MSISALAQPQTQSQLQYGQQPFTQQQSWQQPQLGPISSQQAYSVAQQPGLPFAAMGNPMAQVVSDTVLRVVSASLATVLEQLRIDPLAQQSLCAQGQLSAQAHSNVLVESARRCAPIVASAFGQIAGTGQQPGGQTAPYQTTMQTPQQIGGQQPWIHGQTPYGVGLTQQGQVPFQGQFVPQPLGYGQQPPTGW